MKEDEYGERHPVQDLGSLGEVAVDHPHQVGEWQVSQDPPHPPVQYSLYRHARLDDIPIAGSLLSGNINFAW